MDSGAPIANIDAYVDEVMKGNFFLNAKMEGSRLYYVDYYRRHAPARMRTFRIVGVILIALSVSLPALAGFNNPSLEYKIVLAVIAGLVAGLTGIQTFFRWDVAWQGYIGAQLALDQLYDLWEVQIAGAKTDPDPKAGMQRTIAATEQFVSQCQQVVLSETKGYFSVQKAPEQKPS